MATVNMATKLGQSIPQSVNSVRFPIGYLETIIDFAVAATTKGSALAASDVIQAINVPPESVVLAAGCEVLVPATATTTTIGIGSTVAASNFVSGFDVVGASANAYAPINSAAYPLQTGGSSASTIDVTLSTLTGTLSAGQIRVFALVADVKDERNPGITARKS